MDEQKLATILSFDGYHPKGAGIGVRNVHQRIQLYYGSDYGLELSSELDVGTLVRLVIPEQSPIQPIKVVQS
jgi:two-component system sensor histidine kinase YesM